MPELIEAAKRLRGRPKAEKKLTQISIRVAPETLDALKSVGRGWQQNVRSALEKEAKRLQSREKRRA